MKFKRAVLTKPEHMELVEVEEEPGEGQVMLKIASCGMCNWELGFWKGELNYQGYPHKLGHEFAGTVVKTGPGCRRLKAGDKVSVLDRGFGGFAEYRVTPESKCVKLAENIDPRYAMGEPQKCIITVLRAAAPEAGDYGIVQGCGPMGMWCVMALAGRSLAGLIAVDVDESKLEFAKKYGATHTINSKIENVTERVKEITGGHMADFVIEGTGIPALLNRAQDYLKTGRGARLILMSSHHDPCKEFDFRKAIERGSQIIAAHPPYSEDEFDDFRRAIALINNGTFDNRALVTHEFKLSNIQTAFETLADKPEGFMKAIVVPDDEGMNEEGKIK